MKQLKERLLTALLRTVGSMPVWASYRLADLLFVLTYYVVRYRRRTVAENLAYAFPNRTARERHRIERSSYRHLTDLLIEIIRSGFINKAEFRRRVTFRNLELLEKVTNHYQQQALVLLIHQGNWEWMLHSAMAQLPLSVDPVYKKLHSQFWEDYMLSSRSRFGATPLALNRVAKEVIRGRDKKRLIVMLADQAGPRKGGYWADFLNRPASFYRGPEKLAEGFKFPVLFAQCIKANPHEQRGHYEIVLHSLAIPAKDDTSGVKLLDQYIATAERCIAEQPETYLWTNRRWKKKPPVDLAI